MERFYEWISARYGPHTAFTVRVWISDWGRFVGAGFALTLAALFLAPHLFETQTPQGYILGDVQSVTVIPGDSDSPPIVAFVTDIGDGQLIQVRTKEQRLASTVTDKICISKSLGNSTGRQRYRLMPMTFCE